MKYTFYCVLLTYLIVGGAPDEPDAVSEEGKATSAPAEGTGGSTKSAPEDSIEVTEVPKVKEDSDPLDGVSGIFEDKGGDAVNVSKNTEPVSPSVALENDPLATKLEIINQAANSSAENLPIDSPHPEEDAEMTVPERQQGNSSGVVERQHSNSTGVASLDIADRPLSEQKPVQVNGMQSDEIIISSGLVITSGNSTTLALPSTEAEPEGAPCKLNRHCGFFEICRKNKEGRKRCTCKTCRSVRDKVCGSDGKMYESLCSLHRASCLEKKKLKEVDITICSEKVSSSPRSFKGLVFSVPNDKTLIQIPEIQPAVQTVDRNAKVSAGNKEDADLSEISHFKTDFQAIVLPTTSHKRLVDYKEKQLKKVSNSIKLVDFKSSPDEDQGTVDKDDTESCPYGVLLKGQCTCKYNCPKISKPVCGSDGITYRNSCFMRYSSCIRRQLISLSKKGQCEVPEDPCSDVQCLSPRTCTNKEGVAVCECPQVCPLVHAPVCGSDGKTYGNPCALAVAACNQDKEIYEDYKGECNSGQSGLGCGNVKCGFGATCIEKRSGVRCVCRMKCRKLKYPVCGTDGKTYASVCHLNLAMCESRINIQVKHKGSCKDKDPCSQLVCRNNSKCVVHNGKARCVCDDSCLGVFRPVCGSDGKTYNNVCSMETAACQSGQPIRKMHDGSCVSGNGCDDYHCKPGRFCRQNLLGYPQCVCRKFCPQHYDTVCGSDDQTYQNECVLRTAACIRDIVLTVKHRGECVSPQLYYLEYHPSGGHSEYPYLDSEDYGEAIPDYDTLDYEDFEPASWFQSQSDEPDGSERIHIDDTASPPEVVTMEDLEEESEEDDDF